MSEKKGEIVKKEEKTEIVYCTQEQVQQAAAS